MAIVVVGVVGAVIAPMMAISVATRVQSQKAEQSLALAQSEIDRVRIMIEQGNLPTDGDAVTPTTTIEFDAGFQTDYWPEQVTATEDRAANVNGPASLADTTTTLREVDINDDDDPDFVVQSYLVEKTGAANTYDMGVRVYDYDAVANATGALSTEEAMLGMTQGGRAQNTQGDRSERPKAVLYTNLGATEGNESLCNWIDYTNDGGTLTKPASCP
jgi:type II secretory pathway pseudopilin PulG